MIRIGVVRLKDYESWIRSLGYDREWKVQAAQADLYKSLVLESAEVGMFSLPLTYDSYLVIINAADIEDFKEVVDKLSHKVPVTLMAYVGLGCSYLEAMKRLRYLGETNGNSMEEKLEDTVAVHFDLDGYNKLMSEKGLYHVEEFMSSALHKVRRASAEYGGLTYYAGGDNIICFVPRECLEGFISNVKAEGFKIGVGVAPRPRDALALAAQALDMIRFERQGDRVLVMRNSQTIR